MIASNFDQIKFLPDISEDGHYGRDILFSSPFPWSTTCRNTKVAAPRGKSRHPTKQAFRTFCGVARVGAGPREKIGNGGVAYRMK